ncbi:MAG: carboxypeptidase-like regulatory domain-containing protein [Streptosporangiales bacterium]
MTSVTGQVCDRDGEGISGALVGVLATDGHQVARGRTDTVGRCVLALPGAGTYLLVAAACDWQPVASYATVDGTEDDPTVLLRLDGVPGWARRTEPVTSPSIADSPASSGTSSAASDPLLAQAAAGLTAALLATRLLSDPGRYPTLVAAAARLASPPAPDDLEARARQAAREVLLPSAERLLAPLVHGAKIRADADVPADQYGRNQ